VLGWAQQARARLSEVDTSDSAVAELRATVDKLSAELAERGGALTRARVAAGEDLAARVTAELTELSMGGAGLVAPVSPAGAGLVRRGRGASGGVLSRVMVALEVVLAERSGGGTLVFDEVDAGVGGRAALSIGRRLAILARTHQVIAVTHLAQVAAFADTHLV